MVFGLSIAGSLTGGMVSFSAGKLTLRAHAGEVNNRCEMILAGAQQNP
jgi:hypothetical protein